MNALNWKSLFAALNPSPIFEVVGLFAEGLATSGDEIHFNETGDPITFSSAKAPTANDKRP